MSIVNMGSEKSQHRKDMDLMELKHLSYEDRLRVVQSKKKRFWRDLTAECLVWVLGTSAQWSQTD